MYCVSEGKSVMFYSGAVKRAGKHHPCVDSTQNSCRLYIHLLASPQNFVTQHDGCVFLFPWSESCHLSRSYALYSLYAGGLDRFSTPRVHF